MRQVQMMRNLGRIPLVTLTLCAAAVAAHFLPEAVRVLLYFDAAQLDAGNLIGLISGHWLHADMEHLIWNVTAFAILGTLIERESRTLLAVAIVTGSLAVDALLLSPLSDLQRYCGLSGMLNTLLGVVLWQQWCRSKSRLIAWVAVGCVTKIVVEVYLGQSIFTDVSWPPFAPAHLAGLVATPLVIALAGPLSLFVLPIKGQHKGNRYSQTD